MIVAVGRLEIGRTRHPRERDHELLIDVLQLLVMVLPVVVLLQMRSTDKVARDYDQVGMFIARNVSNHIKCELVRVFVLAKVKIGELHNLVPTARSQ